MLWSILRSFRVVAIMFFREPEIRRESLDLCHRGVDLVLLRC